MEQRDYALRERDILDEGFTRSYPCYEKGNLCIYAMEDDDRLDVYYEQLPDSSLGKRLRKVGDLYDMLPSTKYALAREYTYGLDWTEFCDDGDDPILYDTEEEATKELNSYIEDVNEAYENGDMDYPYQGDCMVISVARMDGEFIGSDVVDKKNWIRKPNRWNGL